MKEYLETFIKLSSCINWLPLQPLTEIKAVHFIVGHSVYSVHFYGYFYKTKFKYSFHLVLICSWHVFINDV